MPKLATIEYCTGCTACASACPRNCISMIADTEGFCFPIVNVKCCVKCGLCEKSCPILNPIAIDRSPIKSYAAYSKNETMRMCSSSGGLFTEIAQAIIQDGGVVYGAAYNERFEVVHICVDNADDLHRLRGAKYAQSNLDGVYFAIKNKLEHNKQVLFSGTPCQVNGLKSYLHKNYENLLTVDFVCHSVPSPMVWQEYVKYRAQKDNGGILPASINLRSKKTGWSRYQYSNVFEYADGNSYAVKSGDSLYMNLFVGGYISRCSCENCHFKGYSRISDLTLGDFWGIWNIDPDFDDNKGVSILLVQSNKGAVILNKIRDDLVLKEVGLEAASRQNQAIIKAHTAHSQRLKAFTLIKLGRIEKCNELFFSTRTPRFHKLKSFLKRLVKKG